MPNCPLHRVSECSPGLPDVPATGQQGAQESGCTNRARNPECDAPEVSDGERHDVTSSHAGSDEGLQGIGDGFGGIVATEAERAITDAEQVTVEASAEL